METETKTIEAPFAALKLREIVYELISALYKPVGCERNRRVVDKARLKEFGINMDNEPINWGDIGVSRVLKLAEGENSWIVELEEASPGACPTLCAYIRRFTEAYGYDVEVTTEW